MNSSIIVDSHTHILPSYVDTKRERFLDTDKTFKELFSNGEKIAKVEELINSMDQNNIDTSIVLGFGWNDIELARRCNEYIIESYIKYPKRIIPFCSVNPNWGDYAIDQISEYLPYGLAGIGELHPSSQEFNLDDPKLAPFWDTLIKYKLPLTLHASEPVGHSYTGKGDVSLLKLTDFITNNPQLKIICAHWGGGLLFYNLMPEIHSILTNTYFDTATSNYLYDDSIFSIGPQLITPDKIIFGSDYPIITQKKVLKSLVSKIKDKTIQENILGRNIKNILKNINKI
tara:strand:+ start:147 stop:1004 length:858 start_codon:yes stop_codon:yes gene_type:complete